MNGSVQLFSVDPDEEDLFTNRSLPVLKLQNSQNSDDENAAASRVSEKFRSVSDYIENGSFSMTTSSIDTLGSNMIEGESSSLNNVFTYQELGQASNDDLELENQFRVVVDRPEKVLATLDTFITFRVVTRTTVGAFSQPEHQVRRRYSDFAWLRQRLETQFPLYFLPALPEKHSVYSLDRYDPEFIKFRCMGLHLFMNWLTKHVSPLDNLDLHNFLHIVDLDQWSHYRKSKSPLVSSNNGYSGPEIPSTSSTGASSLAQKCLSGIDKDANEFHVHNNYCTKLGQTLSSLDKMAVKMLKAEQEYLKELECFHTVFNYWGESESSCELRDAVSAAASAWKTTVDTVTVTSRRFEPQFIVPAHQFALFTDSVRSVLRKRDNIESEHKNAVENLHKKTIEYEVLLRNSDNSAVNNSGSGVSRSTSNAMVSSVGGRNKDIDSKVSKLDQQIKELKKKVERWAISLKQANVEVHSELNRWLKLKDSELKHLIASVARQRVDLHRQCLAKWETALDAAQNDN